MEIKNKKKISGVFVIILIIIAILTQNEDIAEYLDENYNIALRTNKSYSLDQEESENLKINTVDLAEHRVVRVVDGDTFVIDYNGKEEKVRLIGVDTPESVHPDESKNTKEGLKMSNYTRDRLQGKVVKLELDVQERDKYGRILAYVYVDGKMYNKELLELGYAKIATYPPNVKYVDDFKKIQKEARENKIGLWK